MCHHSQHWADGGATDVGNAALLCGRHHTIVHRKRYLGEVVDGHVRWVLTAGSYDHWLAERPDALADRPPVRSYDFWDQLETGAGGPELPPPWRP
jgi:hypothetical protein